MVYCCLSIGAWGQVNYVKNPGLELYDSCPNSWHNINDAKYWSALDSNLIHYSPTNGQPEYENTCSVIVISNIPTNNYFYHYAHSGNGMALVGLFTDFADQTPYKRDYLQGRFYNALKSGHTYCVTFYTAFCTNFDDYAINKIGAYIDNGEIDTTSFPGAIQTAYTPQIIEYNIINADTNGHDSTFWTKIEGSFTAIGNERFITIGNFFDSASISLVKVAAGFNGGSVYLFDDISVIESNTIANAGNDTIIHQGDSILLGEIAVPYTWYKRTSTGLSLIDSTSGGIWVKPDSTTTYVVKLTLCGVVTWDSIKVSVLPAGLNTYSNKYKTLLYPNPIDNELFIENAPQGTSIRFYDVVGRLVNSGVLHTKKESINTSAWERGTYFVEMLYSDGSREIRKVVK